MLTDIALGTGKSKGRASQDEGRFAPDMISIIKRNNVGKALEIARQSRDMHGVMELVKSTKSSAT